MALTYVNMTTNDDWSEPWVPPVKIKEEWEKEFCACDKCRISMSFHDAGKRPPFGHCFKDMAYEKVLEQKAQYLVRPWTEQKPFKPASRDQIAEWASWLASPEAAQAARRADPASGCGRTGHKLHTCRGAAYLRRLSRLRLRLGARRHAGPPCPPPAASRPGAPLSRGGAASPPRLRPTSGPPRRPPLR